MTQWIYSHEGGLLVEEVGMARSPVLRSDLTCPPLTEAGVGSEQCLLSSNLKQQVFSILLQL